MARVTVSRAGERIHVDGAQLLRSGILLEDYLILNEVMSKRTELAFGPRAPEAMCAQTDLQLATLTLYKYTVFEVFSQPSTSIRRQFRRPAAER